MPNSTITARKGWTPAEFLERTDPDNYRTYRHALDRYIAECGGRFSPASSTGEQSRLMMIWSPLRRQMAEDGAARLSNEGYGVSAIAKDSIVRTSIDRDLIGKFTVWNIEEAQFHEPHGRTIDGVRIHPPKGLRSKAGRKLTYDWPGLANELRKHVEMSRIGSEAELKEWCRINVVDLSDQDQTPSERALIEAIHTYRLAEIAGVTMD